MSHLKNSMIAALLIFALALAIAPATASAQDQPAGAQATAAEAVQDAVAAIETAAADAANEIEQAGEEAAADIEGALADAEAAEEAAEEEGVQEYQFRVKYVEKVVKGSLKDVLYLVFLITVLGYLLGKIEIKGVGLGTAGVFLVALVFGHFGFADNSYLHQLGLVNIDQSVMKSSMKLVEQIGLLCFVTSVGFIAGPKFFANLRKNAASYGLLALVIIGSAAITCAAIIKLTNIGAPMAVGILSGALTTTPGFSAAKEALPTEALKDIVTVGHAIGYPFGVVGVVLFVQIVPLVLRANMTEEQKKLNASADDFGERPIPAKLMKLDPIGLGPFALAIILGVVLGKIYIPLPGGATFSLGNTGGALIMGLILGHYGHIGPISMRIGSEFLKSFREFGLVLFLIGAGVPGGGGFMEQLREYGWILFVYGAIMELIPMFLGFWVATKVVKLCLLNSLGSITGGMTSTPALGALINTAKTDDVAAAYAATYPVALVLVVLASQFLVTLPIFQ